MHSCTDCRVSRGDGEHVLELSRQLRPSRIVFDFDRILASTRRGAPPVFGKHSIDHDLLSLLWLHPGSCVIVTHNRHREEILAFLAAHDAPEDLEVHVLKRLNSKAEFVVQGLTNDACALLVDDDIAVLSDSVVAGDVRVHRVLFRRGL